MKAAWFSALFFIASAAQAEHYWVTNSISWLSEQVPESLEMDLERQGVRFNEGKQKTYGLTLRHDISEDWLLDTRLSYFKTRVRQGLAQQKFSYYGLSSIPRYKLSDRLNLGLGLELLSAPELDLIDGNRIELGMTRTWVLSTQFRLDHSDNWFDLSLRRVQHLSVDNLYAPLGDRTEKALFVQFTGRF